MESATSVRLPKVAIQFCVRCKWNLRAAYFAQELLQTFSNDLGEVSLIPVTGGIFTITLYSKHENPTEEAVSEHLVWDRKRDGGFPEVKELKDRVRNIIDPDRDMGHVDRALRNAKQPEPWGDKPAGNSSQDVFEQAKSLGAQQPTKCEDCEQPPHSDQSR